MARPVVPNSSAGRKTRSSCPAKPARRVATYPGHCSRELTVSHCAAWSWIPNGAIRIATPGSTTFSRCYARFRLPPESSPAESALTRAIHWWVKPRGLD